jgi:hypothetical protein
MVFRWGSKTKKWQIEAKPTWHYFWGKINWFRPKTNSWKGELMIWRTKMQARVQGRLQLKDSICYKWVQIGSYKVGPWNPAKVFMHNYNKEELPVNWCEFGASSYTIKTLVSTAKCWWCQIDYCQCNIMLLDWVLISNFLTLFSIHKLQQWFHHVTLQWHKLFGGALDREIVILPPKKEKEEEIIQSTGEEDIACALMNEWIKLGKWTCDWGNWMHNNVKLSWPLFVRKESTTHFCFNWGHFTSAKPTHLGTHLFKEVCQ